VVAGIIREDTSGIADTRVRRVHCDAVVIRALAIEVVGRALKPRSLSENPSYSELS
jgi:hypothetical protein